MVQKTTGYIYRSHDKIGIFQDVKAGQVVSNPTQDPPWIIVYHTLADTLAPKWPGTLFKAEVIEAINPQNHRGNYTRCVAVRIIETVETAVLFGKYGTQVESILEFASRLTLDTALKLSENRADAASALTSEGFHRWMAKSNFVYRDPTRDLSGVVAIGSGNRKSPIGHGLSLVHRCVRDAAQREIGEDAFDSDEESMWLKHPWSDASGALLETAWGLGVPDLFDEREKALLLQAWHRC